MGVKIFVTILLLFILILFSKCSLLVSESFPLQSEEPFPGTVKLNDSIFIDEFLITTHHWMEYTYWTCRIFGSDSKECFNCNIPAVQSDSCYWELYLYCVQPRFKTYPVVGITLNQVIDFLNWRSDRVFEYYLIKRGVLGMQANQTADNYFSIENYYAGNYNNSPPDSSCIYYPVFKLPTHKEMVAKQSLNQLNLKERKKLRFNKDCVSSGKLYLEDASDQEKPSCYIDIMNVYCQEYMDSMRIEYKVFEWLNAKDSAYNFYGDKNTIYKVFSEDSLSFQIGFRGIATWEKHNFSK